MFRVTLPNKVVFVFIFNRKQTWNEKNVCTETSNSVMSLPSRRVVQLEYNFLIQQSHCLLA